MIERIEFENARADILCFDNGTEVREYHAMIHVSQKRLPYAQQLEAVMNAYHGLLDRLPDTQAVFKRYFLSDAANQADEIVVADVTDCAKSIIEQAPLDGTKVALWVYLMSGVQTGMTKSGLYEARHGQFRHLWNASAHNLAANSGARNQVFFTQGLTVHTHFIASTGIGGRQQDPNVLAQMDNYAIDGINKEQVHYLYAPTHLNRTSDYGVSFERGTYIDYADRRHVFISGTASINNKGEIMFPKDVEKQTRRMWENVEALLKEADCTYDNVMEMVVYLRDVADYEIVKALYEERFPDKPYVITLAPVCRPGWLVEMECMAIKQQDKPEFPFF